MKKIAIISDTHSYIDQKIHTLIKNCDEIWHAGDFGYSEEINDFIKKYNVKGVYGNIDGHQIRSLFPNILKFKCEKIKILITHIGGYPKKYKPNILKEIKNYNPDLYICGHSHILKIMHDEENKLLHINPGASGKEGFHKVRTLVLLEIDRVKISNIQVVELGPRTNLTKPINRIN